MMSARHPLRRRGVLPVLLLLLTTIGLTAGPASASDSDPQDVVLIGAPGLSWSDVTPEATPAIHSFAGSAAISNLNVRSTYFTSCPADGWLGLSAGTRAAEPRDVTRAQLRAHPRALPDCSPLPTSSSWSASDVDRAYWRDLGARVSQQGFDAQIGRLGQTIDRNGDCIAGEGPGAVLAMPDPDGEVPTNLEADHCRVTLVGAPPISVPEEGDVRSRQVAAVDGVVDDVLASVDSDTVVILAGLSDDGGQPGLRALAMGGGGIRPGWLHSDSTTRDEMAQVSDVTHTVMSVSGVEPTRIDGPAMRPVGDDAPVDERIASLVDDDAQLQAADAVIPPFFRSFGIGLVALLGAAALVGRFGPKRWRPVLARGVGLVGLAAMAVPASTYLVTLTRWFDSAMPMADFVLRLAVIALALVALALGVTWAALRWTPLRERSDGPATALVSVGVVSAVTFAVLAGDLLFGSGRMTMLSVLGLLPLDGGRFHGFGNVPFAIFVAAAFLLMTALADPLLAEGRRRDAAFLVVLVGVATFAVDAWLGADGGGALALIPSVGYLVLAVAGVRLTWPKVLGIAVATVVGFLAMAGADWLRPEQERTHLGRFFQSLLDGDAWGIVGRKLQTNVDLLLGPERAALLVPVLLIALIWVLARPSSTVGQRLQPTFETYPALRVGLIGLVIALTVGFLLNDSGTAIPAAAALVLGPALVVLWVGLWREPASS